MGLETAALGLVGASALFGAHQTARASRAAKRAAGEEHAAINESRQRLSKDQAKLSKNVEQQQRKLAVAQARSNRARLRGGVFGESQPTESPLTPTLG